MLRRSDVTMTYRKDRAERQALAGIIVGGVLFIITTALLIYGMTVM